MNLLAIVPCRMGDSEIPDKCNRTDTPTGQSLLTLAIQFALDLTDDVLVTTPKHPPVTPLKRIYWRQRPESLCGPEVPMRGVVNDALWYWRELGKDFDTWVLLQPTTPSRTLEEVHAMIEASTASGVTCSIEPVPVEFSPSRARYLSPDGELVPVDGDATRRQAARIAYRRNGVAYVGTRKWEADDPLFGVCTQPHPTMDTMNDWRAFLSQAQSRQVILAQRAKELGF
jgi:CMP-N,N'-diacetyllegionaminic acid synthase